MNKEACYIRFNDVIVSLLELRVWFREKQLDFSLRQFRLLLALLEEPYRAISREDLIQRADLMSNAALQVMICKLRNAFDHQYIVTSYEYGYAFARMPFQAWKDKMLEERQNDVKTD